jgi:hypothetical protein
MTETKEKPFDTVGFIMDWEGGDLSDDDTIIGFQHLIDNGMAWSLQGCYGRTARQLIERGLCVDTHNVITPKPEG